jgi:hypothetical protein
MLISEENQDFVAEIFRKITMEEEETFWIASGDVPEVWNSSLFRIQKVEALLRYIQKVIGDERKWPNSLVRSILWGIIIVSVSFGGKFDVISETFR